MMRRVFWFLLLMCMAVCATSLAQSYEAHGLRFVVQPGFNNSLDSGYVYVRVNVTNTTAKDRSVRLFFDAQGNELKTVSKSFTIAANESRQEALIFPTMEFSSRGLEVEVDGQTSEKRLTPYLRTYFSGTRSIDALADGNFTRQELDDVFGTGGPLDYANFNLKQFEGSNSQLFKDWIGYSQYRLLFFYGRTLTSFEPEIRDAVFDYVRMGGKLFCLGHSVLPDDFKPVKPTPGLSGKIQVFSGGFGQIHVTAKTDITRLDSVEFSAIGNLSHEPEVSIPGRIASPVAFRDQDLETISTVSLLIVIYIFAFLIGPVNIYWLYKYGHKIYVFWTVPVFSALFCLLFFSYYWVMERPIFKANQISLTFLDQENARAMTSAELGVYSARNRSRGMHFPMTAEIFPHRNSVEFPKVIKLDRDQHFGEGWLRPKVPRYFSVKQLESRREQVQLIHDSDGYNLLNGLGADIIEITVRDYSSRLWHAKIITSGATGQLLPVEGSQALNNSTAAHNYISPVSIYELGWHRSIKDFRRFPENFLGPGMYLARLRRCPFFPDRFDGRAELSVDSYVIGLFKRQS